MIVIGEGSVCVCWCGVTTWSWMVSRGERILASLMRQCLPNLILLRETAKGRGHDYNIVTRDGKGGHKCNNVTRNVIPKATHTNQAHGSWAVSSLTAHRGLCRIYY